MTPLEALSRRWEIEEELRALGVTVTGGGIDANGEWEIFVIDPHQRRGPEISLFGEEEVRKFKERIRAR